jgi:DNA-binding MarR family transcriptional regulator
MKKEKTEQRLSLFSRKELRDFTGWSEFQVRTHLERLEQMEYVHRRSGKQGSLCKYELLVEASEAEKSWHIGLIDVEKLRRKKP